MQRSIELSIWGGDWGLPSIDIECLQILVYCKFAGAAVEVTTSNNPYRETLPSFRQGANTYHNLRDVVNCLKKKNINADYALDDAQISQVDAYGEFLKEKLYPALQYIWWVDARNHQELTRPWYCKALPFPLNFYYPGKYQKEAKALVSVLYGSLEEDPTTVETLVYSDAEKCLTMLSKRLGTSQYFLGSSPTSLDALIFSYLAPLLKAPFPKAVLQNHLKSCTNLVSFVNRIVQKYYPTLNNEYLKQHAETKRQETETEFPNKRRNKFIFGIIATAALAGYALSSGILQVSYEDDDEEYEDYVPAADSSAD